MLLVLALTWPRADKSGKLWALAATSLDLETPVPVCLVRTSDWNSVAGIELTVILLTNVSYSSSCTYLWSGT